MHCFNIRIESESVSVVSDSLRPHGLSMEFSRQNTGVGSHSLLQGIFPTQGSNPGLPHCKQILYQLSHKGSPRILEWVAYSFSSRSSWPRNWTRVSWIAGNFFTKEPGTCFPTCSQDAESSTILRSIPKWSSSTPLVNSVPLGFPVGSMVKNLPTMQETQVQSLGWEDPLEKGMAIHFCILA